MLPKIRYEGLSGKVRTSSHVHFRLKPILLPAAHIWLDTLPAVCYDNVAKRVFATITLICHARERNDLTQRDRLLDRILSGTADANISFYWIVSVATSFGI